MDIAGTSPRRSGYELGCAIKMEVVNSSDGKYEQRANQPGSSTESFESSTSDSGDFSEEGSDDDLKEDLQKTILQCYKSESNITLQSNDITNDEEFQATALCQFMDILNDLDEVLDKSLLACLDDACLVDESLCLDSDEEDLICKAKKSIDYKGETSTESQNILDDDTEVVAFNNVQTYQIQSEETLQSNANERVCIKIGRSKSFSELSGTQQEALICSLERNNTTAENIRNSMRRLDPIVLPAITAEQPLTLPVILFLEHHVNMRPTSAPIQVQVTAANLSTDGSSRPLIVGRRALLMNRTLSLPSPGDSDVTGIWAGRNNSRSTARSSSTSSSSMESLAGALSNNIAAGAGEDRSSENDEDSPFGIWPHRMSAMLACLSCTVGIFNLSRFAMLSVNFGASFIIQFFILSLLLGIPLFTLHLCLGQVLEAGPINMWHVSPIFKGVGIALLLIQAVIGVYSMMGLSWIFVYFRDSFITSEDRYKWTLPYEYNFEDAPLKNGSFRIQETIPQYFHGEVLQRDLTSPKLNFGTIKFQVAFNLAVVWMIVFIVLSKGLRSYGKAVYLLIFLPICGTLVLCTKLLTLIPYDTVINIFSETEWSEFFIISNSWASATQEVFLTWGILGPCIMQLTSHRSSKSKSPSVLQRESACIISFTFAMLLLAAFLANTCVQILKSYGFIYLPNFENEQFLWPVTEPLPGNMASTPTRYMTHYSSLVGITVWKSANIARGSSMWQPLQLATQIVPATLAVLPKYVLSPAWAVIFYFILIMFGLAQQLAIWHCVITGIMAFNIKALKVWETTITFLSCVGALALGLFLSTDGGMKIVQLLDITWVGSWLHCALQIALTCGLFAVRGRPYSADVIVSALYASSNKLSATVAAILSFVWTVALPVLLCAICVMDFKIGQYRQFYTWRKPAGQWSIFVRQLVVLMQQGTLLLLPVTAFIQTWRYMSKGPPDILDRIQNLYRPRLSIPSETPPPSAPAVPPPDPPPKYTPPPSYSTATAARLMNTLTRSFRTLRRITTSRPQSTQNTSQIPITLSESVDRERMDSQPPEYSGVFTPPNITVTDETDSRARPLSSTSRNSMTITRDILRRSFVRKSDSVKSIRSSLRRSFKYGGALTTSHEHLVRDAEPISNTVAMSAMLDSDSTTHTRSLASVI